ncbi:MAG TPA: hypothetical protein VF714_06240 [Jatrophihabitans sp.]
MVAGSAWFAINGAQPGALALGLAGYAVLMALVQLRLIPVSRRVPFGPGWWSFSFLRTVRGLARGTFLPRPAAAAPVLPSKQATTQV